MLIDEEKEDRRKRPVLTDSEREDISERVFKKFQESFYMNVGKGIWKAVWKIALLGMFIIAAYGAGSGWAFFKGASIKFGGP